MFATILSFFLLANPWVNTLLEHHLNTLEGRHAFLVEKLTPYVERANQLNQEINAYSERIAHASGFDEESLYISEQMVQKITKMSEMLPVLELALQVDTDFGQIDAILNSDYLTAEQEAAAERLSCLCNLVDPRQ